MKIYNVVFNWATEDDSNVEIDSYVSYEAAKKAFETIIKDEMNPEVSWVGDVFNPDGSYNTRLYDLKQSPVYTDGEEHELYWIVSSSGNITYDEVYLKICEAK